ncbi:MAG: YidC/Oxa1 family membrane protein insertase [Actinobacteria bacterium]|nr:YidC/Oxa1 family membrane protein insertase [Actinomycetota bacterium]
MFQAAAWLVATFYAWTHNYAIAIALVSVAIMLLITPLTLKSTKGMLEMQRLQPEMRRLQQQYKGDRQKLNEEMMKLYQEHKVNPLASCLPLLAQLPVFFIMFRVLHGLTQIGADGKFDPQYIDKASELFVSLNEKSKMVSFGLDLAVTPVEALQDNFAYGLWYALLVIAMAALFLIQQRMIASRTVNPTMSATQAKIMQYLPVAFAFFQVFLPTGLVVYYAVQAVIRILQQWYITRRFYGDEGALGRQAQQASTKARDIKVEEDKSSSKKKADDSPAAPIVSKRVTPSKNKPSPSGRVNRPTPPGRSGNRHRKPGK